MNTNINWNTYFEHIWCLHYLPYTDRYEHSLNEFKRLGILDSNIFEFKYTYNNPLQVKIGFSNCLNFDGVMKNIICKQHNLGILNTTLAHYEIVKESLYRGFRRILIVEDDNIYLKDLDLMKSILDNIPGDFDMCLLNRTNTLLSSEQFAYITANNSVNDYYSKLACDGLVSFGGIVMNSVFMQTYVKSQEQVFRPADFACQFSNGNINELNRYYAKIPISVQTYFNSGCMGGFSNEQIKNIKIKDTIKSLIDFEDYE